jgi:hypothetical protein
MVSAPTASASEPAVSRVKRGAVLRRRFIVVLSV